MSGGFSPYINGFRLEAGLLVINEHPILTEAAALHAADLARREVLSHGSGPGNTDTAANRIAALGYRWGWVAENVAFGQRDSAEVLAAWAGSPGHRANMEAREAVHFGFGGASNRMGPYWVLVLAAPL